MFCSLSVIMKSRSILNSMKICHGAAEGTQEFISRGEKRWNRGRIQSEMQKSQGQEHRALLVQVPAAHALSVDPRAARGCPAWPGAVGGGKE